MLDEFIHHGAEIALLATSGAGSTRPLPTIPESNGSSAATRACSTSSTVEPPTADLVDQAAGYGRWDLVIGLVQRGAPISTTGRTPLHLAAGAGELEVVKTLLDHGADPAVTDPEFHATPLQWAEFLRRRAVSEYLIDARDAQTSMHDPQAGRGR